MSSRRENPRRGQLPDYNVARGAVDTLLLFPPFSFQGVTLYYLPLRASLSRLQSLVNRCLNSVGPGADGLHYFEVSAPFVFMVLADYSQIEPAITELGWLDQYELAFLVPLSWYRRRKRDGKLAFYEPASFSPFLFVDDTISMANARDVYGWPKCMGGFESELKDWFGRPGEPQTKLRVYNRQILQALSGEPTTVPPLVWVDYTNPAIFSRFPPKLRNLPNPLATMGQWTQAAMDFVSFLFKGSSATRSERRYEREMTGHVDISTMGMPAYAMQGANYFRFFLEQLVSGAPSIVNNINLKQIPRPYAKGPWAPEASYKALTNAPMSITQFYAMGAIGFDNLMLGQFNAGYQVYFRRDTAAPIVSMLGLRVASTVRDPTGDHICDVVEPEFPFWIQADMEYGAGQILACTSSLPGQAPLAFDACTGTSLQLVRLPLVSPRAAGQVYALPADKVVLDKFIKDYLGASSPESLEFKAFGSFVYLITIKNNALRSVDSPSSMLDTTEVYLAVPVLYKENGVWSASLVVPFAFATNPTVVSTFVEVLGVPMQLGDVSTSGSSWAGIGAAYPVTEDIFTLSAQLIPAYYAGMKDGWYRVVSVSRDFPVSESNKTMWQKIRERYGPVLEEKHTNIVADSEHPLFEVAASLLAGYIQRGEPIPLLALKQSRDTEEPMKACLQALVRFDVTCSSLTVRDVQDLLHVCIHRYQTLNIAHVLGLEIKHSIVRGRDIVDIFQPQRVFSFGGRMEYGRGAIWYERINSTDWVRNPNVPLPGATRSVARNAAALADASPNRPREWLVQGAELLSHDESNAALLALKEPLSVLERALGKGWLRGDEPMRQAPPVDHYVRLDSFGNEDVRKEFFSSWTHAEGEPVGWKVTRSSAGDETTGGSD